MAKGYTFKDELKAEQNEREDTSQCMLELLQSSLSKVKEQIDVEKKER